MKKNNDTGTPTRMLFAKIMLLSRSLCSKQEKASAIILIRGRAIINPARVGFFKDNQLAKAIIKPERKTLMKKKNIEWKIVPYDNKYFK